MKKEKLIDLFKFIIELIEKDDSMEGRIQYTFDPNNPGEFLTDTFVRHRNSEGQGSCFFLNEHIPSDAFKKSINVVEEGTDFDGKFKVFE